jgi:hypothetical protein
MYLPANSPAYDDEEITGFGIVNYFKLIKD